jgi:hypothetical protein
MAYDRYDTRNAPRDDNNRWSDDRDRNRDPNRAYGRGDDDRGFFERAGDEVASWFGDEDAERRRREDRMRDEREGGWSSRGRDYDRGYGRDRDRDRERMSGDRDRNRDRNWYQTKGLNERGGWSESDYNPSWRRELSEGQRDRGYRPVTGDYGRGSDHESEQFFAASGYGRGERGSGGYDRSQSPYGRDQYRRTSYAGSREGEFDPHYRSWRDRHMSDLDRDYDDYRRENQSRFENDFGSWRERRMKKRGMLGQVREHMEVVGNDEKHVGTVDRVAGDRIVLTKSDQESGGVHHSLSCSDIDKVEGDKVILDCSADEAHRRWRDESRSRALFEREDQGEMGPRNLNRSFEGTYR